MNHVAPLNPEHVGPLSAVSGRYLQVLLNTISLRYDNDAVSLEVQFDANTPAIWSRHGRRAVFAYYAPLLMLTLLKRSETD